MASPPHVDFKKKNKNKTPSRLSPTTPTTDVPSLQLTESVMVANFQKSMMNFLKNIAGAPAQNMAGGQVDVAIPLLDGSNENIVTPEQKPLQMQYVTPTHYSTPKKTKACRQLDMNLGHAF